ncbi:hypothetical protein [Veillonella magna]|uniref:Uncharacterized protein n=1 Tax=Veillonella magna TaxID=464322 RepID=A0ABS2GHN3_9FIRM|nr:hypothetical protein [Veillonella magna]MBM6825381.1 hypothetical protein [Veillonella magna]MBM6913676.1 hypothetical protein [Veillonella magna]
MGKKHYDGHCDEHYDKLLCFFTAAEARFSLLDWQLIEQGLAERTLCGALMNRLNEIICFDGQSYNLAPETVADVEYNRRWKSQLDGDDGDNKKRIVVERKENRRKHKGYIFTDIIVHKRKSTCNEIAIEVKKIGNSDHITRREKKGIHSDRERLKNLTSQDGDYKYKMEILCIFHPWDIQVNSFGITHEFYKYGEFLDKEVVIYTVKKERESTKAEGIHALML